MCVYALQLDVRWVDWAQPHTLMDYHSFCAWRHLLNLEGRSYANRFKYLLLCGSAVVHPRSDWIEFWHPALRHNVNYYATESITVENGGKPVVEAAKVLARDEQLAKRWGSHSLSARRIHHIPRNVLFLAGQWWRLQRCW